MAGAKPAPSAPRPRSASASSLAELVSVGEGEEAPASSQPKSPLMYVGRYAVFEEIASGGFASVHVGRSIGAGGFARTVAIKRLHRQYAKDPEVSAMFLDEARVVARIRHPNVMPTIDLIDGDDELFLVMEYVEGVTLRHLHRHATSRGRRIPLSVALRIMCGSLRGLHAAHEAHDERGEPLHVVHRDVSPENILVGVDGHPRLLDFGVARALNQFHATRDGEVKGKLQYLTPEMVHGEVVTRRSDIFSASVVLWEVITGKQLFHEKSIAAISRAVLEKRIPPPSEVAGTPKKLDGIVMQGLERDPDERWSTAEKMAHALEVVGELAGDPVVARYVRQAGGSRLKDRQATVARVEASELDAPASTGSSIRLSRPSNLHLEAAVSSERPSANEATGRYGANVEPKAIDAAHAVPDSGRATPTSPSLAAGADSPPFEVRTAGALASPRGAAIDDEDTDVGRDDSAMRRWAPVLVVGTVMGVLGALAAGWMREPAPLATPAAPTAPPEATPPLPAAPPAQPSPAPAAAPEPATSGAATATAEEAPEPAPDPVVRQPPPVRPAPPPPPTNTGLYGRE